MTITERSKMALSLVLAVVVSLFLLVGIVHATGFPSKLVYYNWAGYIAVSNTSNIQNNTVSMINGTWIVQNVSATTVPMASSTEWIGIDGAINDFLIQTGTESDFYGAPYYYPWYETLPESETAIPGFSVNPGDRMYARILLLNASSNLWSVYLQDLTNGESFNTTIIYNTPRSSAEWIDERAYFGYFPPLANFHIGYYGSDYTGVQKTDYARISNVTSNLVSLPAASAEMEYFTGNILAIPSKLSSTGSFNVLAVEQASINPLPPMGMDVGSTQNVAGITYGGLPPYTYQWYEDPSGSQTFSQLSGATSNAYSFSTNQQSALGTYGFRFSLKDTRGNLSNATAYVNLNKLPSFNSQPNASASNMIITIGQNAIINYALPINGTSPFAYKWYEQTPGSGSFNVIKTADILAFDNSSTNPFTSTGQSSFNSCVSYNGYVYCVDSSGSIYGRAVNGNVLNWSNTTAYPIGRYQSCVQARGNIYCVAGLYANGTASNKTYYAPLSSNGIGNWVETSPYLQTNYGATCSTDGNYIYCVGGVNNNYWNDYTFYAPISANGIGQWIQTTNYPLIIQENNCQTANGFIYCVGGSGGYYPNFPFTALNYYAPVSASGIGQWKSTTPLPTPIGFESCNIGGNYIYCNSGLDSTGYSNQSFYAPISKNGIGNWTESGNYKVKLLGNSCTISNGYIYCTGGCDGGTTVTQEVWEYYCAYYAGLPTFSEKVLPMQYTFNPNLTTTPGTYNFYLGATDTDGASINSTKVAVTLKPFPIPKITIPQPVIYLGQNETVTANVSGGTPPYNQFAWKLNNNTLGQTGQSIIIYANASDLGTDNIQLTVTDNALQQTTVNSTITAISNLDRTSSITASNTILDAGQYTAISGYATGGSGTYNYNFTIFNSITNSIIANQLGSSNIFVVASNSLWTTNSPVRANVIITDTRTTPQYSYGPNSIPITIYSIPNISISESNVVLDSGQWATFTLSESGGAGPKFNAELYNVTGSSQVQSNVLITSVGGSNTISFRVSSPTRSNGFLFSTNSYDEGTTTPFSFQSSPHVIGTIPVGSDPYGITLNPSDTLAYVTDSDGTTVNVVNLATNRVVNTINVGYYPQSTVFNPSGTLAYVTIASSGTVDVINTTTYTIINTITVGGAGSIVLNPSGTLAYVVNGGSKNISIISTSSNTVVGNIPTEGLTPTAIAINPSGTIAYVSNQGSNYVSVINIATNTVVNTIAISSIGYGPSGVAFNPSGTLAYANNYAQQIICVINIATNTIIKTIDVPTPEAVAFNPSGTLAYVVGYSSPTASVIDVATNTVIETIPVGSDPAGIALSPSGNLAYVTNQGSGTVSLISAAFGALTVSPALATPTLTASNAPTVMSGQYELFDVSFTGGTSPYTYNYQVVNTVSGMPVANMLLTNSFTSNSWLWGPITAADGGNTVNVNVIVTDSASTQARANSTHTQAITIISLYTQPTTPSLTLSNALIDQGQSIMFTAAFTNGTAPYTYNYQIVNSITGSTIANQLYVGNSYTSNTFIWTPPANLYTSNTFKANVVVIDSNPTAVNSIYSSIGYSGSAIIQLSVANTVLDAGQYATFTLTDVGGTGAKFNAELYNQSGSSQVQSNVLILRVGGSNTISFKTSANGAFAYNAIEYDEGTTTPFTNNSIARTITVNKNPTVTISSTNTLLDSGQLITLTATVSGGTPPFKYTFYNVTGSQTAIAGCTGISADVCSLKTGSPTNGNTFNYNVVVADSATTPSTLNSTHQSITVNEILAIPTIAASNTLLVNGQYTVISSYEAGGTNPYTYNFIVFNSVSNTIIANQLGTSNAFSIQSNPLWTTNSPLKANVVVTDRATTPISSNSVKSVAITVSASPAVVSSTNTVVFVPSSATVTLSHAIASGSNRLVLVGVSWKSSHIAISGIKWDVGSSCTSYSSSQALSYISGTNSLNPSNLAGTQIWQLVAPDIGSGNICVTLKGGLPNEMAVGATDFAGASQTPISSGTINKGDASSASISTTSTSGDMVFGVEGSPSSAPTATGTGQTDQWSISKTSPEFAAAGSTQISGGSPITTSWSIGSSQDWSVSAVEIQG